MDKLLVLQFYQCKRKTLQDVQRTLARENASGQLVFQCASVKKLFYYNVKSATIAPKIRMNVIELRDVPRCTTLQAFHLSLRALEINLESVYYFQSDYRSCVVGSAERFFESAITHERDVLQTKVASRFSGNVP
jgi:hypothetical protein